METDIKDTETERQGQQSQQATTKKVSDCQECGSKIEYTPLALFGREFQFAPRYCEACGPIVKSREAELANRQRVSEKMEHWSRICPPIFLETKENLLPSAQFERAKAWNWKNGKSLLLHGMTGRSKTRIAWVILWRYYLASNREDRDSVVLALSAAEFSRQSSDYASGGKSQQWADRLINVGCLFIDDIGKGRMTERNESDLFDILDQRFSYKKPTIITTNTVGEDLEKRLDPDRGTPLVRRLREFCDCISFT